MEQNHTTNSEAVHVPVVPQDEMDRVVDCITDGLVDAWEDALADVDYNLNKDYDANRLVESMQLAIQINSHIEFLKQYHSTALNPEGGQ